MSIQDLFEQSLKIINIGLIDFFETLEKYGVEARHVEPALEEKSENNNEGSERT